MDVVEAAAAPAADVLPAGVRRRLTRQDAWLPLVLTGELLAGMLLGGAWHVATAVPEARPPVVGSVATGDAPAPAGGAAPVLPSAAQPPPPRTEPRNPFAMQVG